MLRYSNPAPGLPRLPVTAGSRAQARITLPPVRWRGSAWPSHRSDGPRPYRWAASAISGAGTLVVAAPHSGVQSASRDSSSSQPMVCAATKPLSTKPSRHSTCSRAKAKAASLPGKGCRWRSAASAVGVHVADGVGDDLGGADAVEEAHREDEGEHRQRGGIVGVDDSVWAGVGAN